jgi:hypothetical protein
MNANDNKTFWAPFAHKCPTCATGYNDPAPAGVELLTPRSLLAFTKEVLTMQTFPHRETYSRILLLVMLLLLAYVSGSLPLELAGGSGEQEGAGVRYGPSFCSIFTGASWCERSSLRTCSDDVACIIAVHIGPVHFFPRRLRAYEFFVGLRCLARGAAPGF